MRSPRSQGKGNRRWPGRPGGAGKAPVVEWEKQAAHATNQLPQPTVILSYWGSWEKKPAENIYRLDQALAKLGIPYRATYHGRLGGFSIHVPAAAREKVEEVLNELKDPPLPRTSSAKVKAWLRPIEPLRLGGTFAKHPWQFVWYGESASERPDGISYHAFLFRDREQGIYGIREYLGEPVPDWDVLRKMAHRVVVDREYRAQMISSDPDAPEMWGTYRG